MPPLRLQRHSPVAGSSQVGFARREKLAGAAPQYATPELHPPADSCLATRSPGRSVPADFGERIAPHFATTAGLRPVAFAASAPRRGEVWLRPG